MTLQGSQSHRRQYMHSSSWAHKLWQAPSGNAGGMLRAYIHSLSSPTNTYACPPTHTLGQSHPHNRQIPTPKASRRHSYSLCARWCVLFWTGTAHPENNFKLHTLPSRSLTRKPDRPRREGTFAKLVCCRTHHPPLRVPSLPGYRKGTPGRTHPSVLFWLACSKTKSPSSSWFICTTLKALVEGLHVSPLHGYLLRQVGQGCQIGRHGLYWKYSGTYLEDESCLEENYEFWKTIVNYWKFFTS